MKWESREKKIMRSSIKSNRKIRVVNWRKVKCKIWERNWSQKVDKINWDKSENLERQNKVRLERSWMRKCREDETVD